MLRASLLLLCVICPDWALAQSPSALRGVVQDELGGIMPGVTIGVGRGLSGLVRDTISGADGRFEITNLPPDRYTLTAVVDGFEPFSAPVTLRTSVPGEVTVILRVAGQATVVEVRPEAPLVDRTLTGPARTSR